MNVPGRLPWMLVPQTKSRFAPKHAPPGYAAVFGDGDPTVEHGGEWPSSTLRRSAQ
jgi:hypothetical protein